MEKEIEKNEHNKESATDRVTIKTWLYNKEFNNSCKNLINFVYRKRKMTYILIHAKILYIYLHYI